MCVRCCCSQVKALKEGKPADKPIYNHVTGLLDPAEKIDSPDVSTTALAAATAAAAAAEMDSMQQDGVVMQQHHQDMQQQLQLQQHRECVSCLTPLNAFFTM